LKFLGLVCAGWIGMRVVLLWPPGATLPEAIRAALPFAAAKPTHYVTTHAPMARPVAAFAFTQPTSPAPQPIPARVRDPLRVKLALLNLLHFGDAEYTDESAAPFAAPIPQQRGFTPPPASRWSASAWLVLRPGTGLGAAPDASQLGGSQAGARISYALGASRRTALYARFATPTAGKGREAAFGIAWQPWRAPLELIAEERIAVDGGRGGPGIGVVGGVDQSLPAKFRLESYGQAGAIARHRIEPYADGAARVTRLLGRRGPIRLALGVGAWGAAQLDAARFDLGPSATLAMPLAGQQIRVALDWRQRVAGDARPGSGLALTLGSDF
jgi:hypothetical protein